MSSDNSFRLDRRQVLVGGTAAAAAVAFPGAGFAQQDAGRLTFGIGNLDSMFAAGFVALKNGYFRDAGLDASFVDGQNGPRARQMLAAGQFDVCASASFDPLIVTAAGKATKVIVGIDQRLPYANVIVRSDEYAKGVKTIADLAGKRIGVSGPQSAFWLMATHMIEKAGLTDVEIRFIGGTPEMLAALKSGQVDASMATITMMEQAQKEGFGVPIVSINEPEVWSAAMGLGGDIPGQWIYALEEFVAERPAAIQAFVTGWLRGNDYVFSHTPEEVADLIHDDFLSSFEKPTLIQAIRTLKDKVWSQHNIVDEAAYGRVLTVMGGGRILSDEQAAAMPYSAAVDMSFARKARGA